MKWLNILKDKIELAKIVDLKIENLKENLMELKQGSFYILYFDTNSDKDIDNLKKCIDEVQNRINWTLPKIIMVNKKIMLREISKEKYKKIKNEVEK